jgi:hypothetical protein
LFHLFLFTDTVLCFEDIPNGLNLDPGRNGLAYQRSKIEAFQIINVTTVGVYRVVIIGSKGFTITDLATVKKDCPEGIWLSNSFTPEGDVLNDSWVI